MHVRVVHTIQMHDIMLTHVDKENNNYNKEIRKEVNQTVKSYKKNCRIKGKRKLNY